MISVYFQGKPFNATVIQVYPPISKAEEAEGEWFYEDLQELFGTNAPKRCPFHYRGLECGRLGLISGLGRSPEEGNRIPFQYSCLENPMEGRAW